jgi:hypothetical protein
MCCRSGNDYDTRANHNDFTDNHHAGSNGRLRRARNICYDIDGPPQRNGGRCVAGRARCLIRHNGSYDRHRFGDFRTDRIDDYQFDHDNGPSQSDRTPDQLRPITCSGSARGRGTFRG